MERGTGLAPGFEPGHLCQACSALSLEDLPYEEEDAIAHHGSLDAFEAAIEFCALCRLLWCAVQCTIPRSGGNVCYASFNTPSNITVKAVITESLYNKMGLRSVGNGGVMLDFSPPPKTDRSIPLYVANMREVFPRGSDWRAYLFGNYYKSPFPNGPKQLIGLGVRIGTSPRIQDAFLNSEDEVNLGGTWLRIRIDPGKVSPGNLDVVAGSYQPFPKSVVLSTAFKSRLGVLGRARVDMSDTRLSAAVPGRIFSADMSGRYATDMIKYDWLDICNRHHACVMTEDPLMPTRVLDVLSNKDVIFLRETSGMRGKYIALSHCWGKSKCITTTKQNVLDHMKGIPIFRLPATFRQAIQTAQELEITYLWIDSLCILQDDASDWEIESSRMGSVYSNSFLTIAADSSKDDISGCYSNMSARLRGTWVSSDVRSTGRRHIGPAIPIIIEHENAPRQFGGACLFAMKPIDKDTSEPSDPRYYMTLEWMPSSPKFAQKSYLIGEFGGLFDPVAEEPLTDRGWTLQERLLAPRTLHYSLDGLFFECQRFLLAEEGAIFPRKFPRMNDLLGSRQPSTATNTLPALKGRDPWPHIVELLSQRKLTYEQDKLPAVSGLANSIAKITGDIYCAGLWKSDFISGLCWEIKTYEPHHQCSDAAHDEALPPPSRSIVQFPNCYRAPTWSWASLNAEIQYHYSSKNAMATVIEVQVVPDGKDLFGKVKDGWVKLKAPLYQLIAAKDDKRRGKHPFTIPVIAEGSNKHGTGFASFDVEPSFPSFLLQLYNDYGLIIQEKKGHKVFRRIGFAEFFGSAWTDVKPSQPDGEYNGVDGTVREVVIE